MANRCVLSVAAGLHCTHDHFAGIDSDTNLDSRVVPRPKVLATAKQFVACRECRVQCALRMVFMRDWRAEQRENTVAGRLYDVTVEAMNPRLSSA